MKNIFCGILVFLGAAVYCSAAGIADEARKGNEKAEMSYAFGMLIAMDLEQTGLKFNYDAFVRGFRETMEKKETMYTPEEAVVKIQAAFAAVQAEVAERNRTVGKSFLAENGKRPGVTVTPSGLQYEVILEGKGEIPGPADIVKVHYRGSTIDGTVFDSTFEDGEPWDVSLDQVIPGWSEGLRMMREGGKAKLYIPPELAYGESGAGSVIGPNSVIIFDIELISIVEPPESTDPF